MKSTGDLGARLRPRRKGGEGRSKRLGRKVRYLPVFGIYCRSFDSQMMGKGKEGEELNGPRKRTWKRNDHWDASERAKCTWGVRAESVPGGRKGRSCDFPLWGKILFELKAVLLKKYP